MRTSIVLMGLLLALAPAAASQTLGGAPASARDGQPSADLQLKTEVVDGFAFDVGVWHDPASALAFGVVLDPLGGVTISLGGHVMATGTTAILGSLPGSQEPATAGTTGCWSLPGPLTGNESIKTVGEGSTLAAAVADYHEQVAELEALGFKPQPSSACDPKVDPLDPAGLGPSGGPGHP